MTLKNSLLIIIIFLLSGITVSGAQTTSIIKGIVTKITGEPLENVVLTLSNSSSKKVALAETGEDGKFHFEGILPGITA